MSFTDKTLVCVDCGNDFVFTAGEQEFYAQKGFTNEPRRCTQCRQSKKQQRSEPSSRSSFNRDSSFGGGRERSREYGGRDSFGGGGRSSFGGGNRRDAAGQASREMYDTVCAECGRTTTVPFKPTQGRPVYCRDCFQKQRTSSRW